ncbi:MAG: hypothetical protein Q8P17_04940 [bacterium]|nr:hypothetical protein [bacterium]
MKTSRKGFISPLLLVLIVVLLIGGGAYAYVQNKGNQSETTQTSDWKTYTSTKYGFSLKYPDINARLKLIGGWTDVDEPKITSRTPFDYNKCELAGEGPGMGASNITIADREYCLIESFGVESGTFGSVYEYVSRIRNEDIGIYFSFSRNQVGGQQVEQEARSLFSQILSTFRLTTDGAGTAPNGAE